MQRLGGLAYWEPGVTADKSAVMHVLLRKLDSGHFWSSAGFWTDDSREARNFDDGVEATEAVKGLGSRAVELVVVGNNGKVIFGCKLDC
jgi:hypothetical protein